MDIPLVKNAPSYSRDKLHLLIEKYQKGCTESGGRAVHSLAPYIFKIVMNCKCPSHVDKEVVFSDCFIECYNALSKYDSTLSSVETFLFPVVNRQAWRTARAYSGETLSLECDVAINTDDSKDLTETIEDIKRVISKIPKSEITEKARQVAFLLIKGRSPSEIADTMEWDRPRASRFIDSVRSHIAWRLVMEGVSAEPWIKDRDLNEMAAEFERKNPGIS